MVVDREALVGDAQVQRDGRGSESTQRVRYGHVGPAERLVDETDSQKLWVSRFEPNQVVAEPSTEELVIVPTGDGVSVRDPWYGAIEPVAEEHEVVGLGEPLREKLELLLSVIIVQGQLADLVFLQVR